MGSWGIVAIAACAGVLFCQGLIVGIAAGRYGSSELQPWLQTMAAVLQGLGVFSAMGVAILVPWLERAKTRREIQDVALMVVATDLRRWLEKCADMVYANDNAMDSEGAMGRHHNIIPPFPFEQRLEAIAVLDSHDARAAFQLIHRKDEMNEDISFEADVGMADDGYARFGSAASELWLEASKLLQHISHRLQWRDDIRASTRDYMTKKVEDYKEYLRRLEDFKIGGVS